MDNLVLSRPDAELKELFFKVQNRGDIANLLEVEYKKLVYHIHIARPHDKYTTFDIPKKKGGVRTIKAPISSLKIIQRKLAYILSLVYQPKPSVHGFTSGKSISTNALPHVNKRFVLNLDLKDFFPSINFGRVRGLFLATPYKLPPEAATVLAQICCHENTLPQGAPTSPIISNMICVQLDSQLQRLAKRSRCMYTRYADDITFSTSIRRFPSSLAFFAEKSLKVELGEELERIIINNGFQINERKVRLASQHHRQEVTGITTNVFPNVQRGYIRQLRAMLHAWEKFGLEAAEKDFREKHDDKWRFDKKKGSFKHVVKGKVEYLGMVRGTEDPIYLKFRSQLKALAPALVKDPNVTAKAPNFIWRPLIITEGKTDWQHIKSAWQKLRGEGYYVQLDLRFLEYGDELKMGCGELRSMCIQYVKALQERITIFVFDNDEPNISREMTIKDRGFKSWGNNVFSLTIPIPPHRVETPEICIELYYQDNEITLADEHNRRLFFNNEFSSRSGRHLSQDLNCTDIKRLRESSKLSIVDDKVFNEKDENVALPKSIFAKYVTQGIGGFKKLDHMAFKLIFDVIQNICTEAQDPFKR